jgi:hypothetical protein
MASNIRGGYVMEGDANPILETWRVFPRLAFGRFRTVALEQSIKEQGAACQRAMLLKKAHILSAASMSRLHKPSRGGSNP